MPGVENQSIRCWEEGVRIVRGFQTTCRLPARRAIFAVQWRAIANIGMLRMTAALACIVPFFLVRDWAKRSPRGMCWELRRLARRFYAQMQQ